MHFFKGKGRSGLKKGDFAVIFVILAAAAVSAFLLLPDKGGDTVVITEDGKAVFEGSLFENRKIELSGNTVEISGGEVRVIYADCKNQICAEHAPISKKGETIICLPNRVIAEIR